MKELKKNCFQLIPLGSTFSHPCEWQQFSCHVKDQCWLKSHKYSIFQFWDGPLILEFPLTYCGCLVIHWTCLMKTEIDCFVIDASYIIPNNLSLRKMRGWFHLKVFCCSSVPGASYAGASKPEYICELPWVAFWSYCSDLGWVAWRNLKSRRDGRNSWYSISHRTSQ